MKMKMYYGALALIWLLSGCTDVPSQARCYNYALIDNHLYGMYSNGFSHMGTCKQCKHELDSIVKNAVGEALEKYGKENWNE